MTSAPMKPSEALRKAADIVAAPGCWTQEAFARNADGLEVPWASSSAACFCSYGAMYRAVGSTESDVLASAEEFFCEAISETYPDIWNDDPARTQSDVVNAFRRAADMADEDEAGDGQ